MKIKTKLRLGLGLLFIMILLLSFLGTLYINALKNDTENILVANYNTLEYSRNMMLALDEALTNPKAYKKFEDNLQKQQSNITEMGEKENTALLTEHFAELKTNPKDSTIHQRIRKDISEIMMLNMQAIQRKSNKARETAASANIWIAVAGSICFIIAFTLLINLPGNIANPIKELTESIKQVAAKNYAQRVHFESHNEFGELANSFNTMAEKLQEYDSSTLSDLLFEKKRIETLINNMHDPLIGLDATKKILFVNNEALKILGMKPEELIGRSATDIAITNDLIRSLLAGMMADKNKATNPDKTPIKIYADNKESYFEKELVTITITPTGEKEQQVIGHVILLKNITPFKELDFAKTNFIATVSHELKTPIASIKMSLQLLENQNTGNINEEQKQLI
ncbi:MAG: HAMP domain-containing protein, partial [Panacibacter sp.]